MSYIVLDMEWNTAKNRHLIITQPFRLNGEIIQIGAVKMNDAMEIVDSFNVYIKPEYYTIMNKRVQEVTLITDEDLKKGIPFSDAIEQFKDFCGEDAILLTWGDSDIEMLEDNLDFKGLDSEWIPENYNVQWTFCDQVTYDDKSYSLDYARYKFNIKGKDAHNALNDAYNTAEVIQHMDLPKWIEEEREYVGEEGEEE